MAETTRPPDAPDAQRIAELQATVATLDERLRAVEADFEKLCALLGTRPSGWIPSSGTTTHLRVVE